MSAQRVGSFVAVLLGATFGWVACNTLLGIEEPELAPPADTGAASDSASEGGEGGCVPEHWPVAPTMDDPSDAGDVTFLAAVKSIGLSLDPPAPKTGYDLDGVCSCPGPESCVRPAGAPQHCDDDNGRDVSLNREVASFLLKTPGFSPEDLNKGLERGAYGLLIEVSGYNGTANDKQVAVSMFLSSGTAGDAGPGWDGGDKWDLEPNGLAGGLDGGTPVSQFVDTTAYVRDGVLVASRLNGVKITLGAPPAAVTLEATQGAMTAKVVKRDGTWTLEGGTLAGRWPTTAMLKAVAPLPAPGSTAPLCNPSNSIFYGIVKGAVCRAADLSSNPSRDVDRGAACDALSFAVRFDAEPAQFGKARMGPRMDAGCSPSWSDKCPE